MDQYIHRLEDWQVILWLGVMEMRGMLCMRMNVMGSNVCIIFTVVLVVCWNVSQLCGFTGRILPGGICVSLIM